MLVITRCIAQACNELKVPYEFVDDNHNFIRVNLHKPYFFVNFATPFGRHDIVKICKDKEFTYKLLNPVIRTPHTIGYLDPFCREGYRKYVKIKSYQKIHKDILSKFELPVIIKRNTGTRGKNVFLCQHETEILAALQKIYHKKSKEYDYVAIAQAYIQPVEEFRVVSFFRDILLVYKKDISHATFVGNLSPLHWENAHAIHVQDEQLIARLHDFLAPVHSVLELQFSGIDVILDEEDNLWVLEINSQPDFDIFARDNGDERVVEVFKVMLRRMMNGKAA